MTRLARLLASVDLRPDVADLFPHELSGGMKQRVCIAIAISLRPKVIVADEPTSALDVVVQRQVMETLRKVQDEIGAAVILIGHDMGLMAQFAQRLIVMCAGHWSRSGDVRDIFARAEAPVYPVAHRQPALVAQLGDTVRTPTMEPEPRMSQRRSAAPLLELRQVTPLRTASGGLLQSAAVPGARRTSR